MRAPRSWTRVAGLEYAVVAAGIALVTVVCRFIPVSYIALGYVYLLAVIALSSRVRCLPALFGAVLSGLAWNFFFVPPRMTLSVPRFDEGLLLTIFLAIALIVSQLTALRAAAERAALLAESEQMHQTLLDSVAHELKTPLAVFRTVASQLGTEDATRRQRLIGELCIALDRIENMVANLLNQARLESGVLKPRLDWCDPRDIVAAARRSVGGQLGEHPLAVEISDDIPLVRADAALLEQVIALLLINAAVHTPSRTPIRIAVGGAAGAARVLIQVADRGPGIPPALQASIFEKFSRGESPRQGGLGLGLSIVRGFTAAQGGTVTVESPPGGGACFTLSLPCAGDEPVPNG